MIETAEIKSAVVEKLYRFLTYFNNEFYPVFSSTVFFDIISLYKEFKDLDKDLSLDTRITREEFLDGLSKKLQLEASNPPNFAVEKLLNIVINDSPVQIPLNDLLYKKPYRLTTPKEVEKANLDLISTCVDFIEKNKNCLPSSFSFKEFFYALFALHKDFLASRQENNGVVLREQNITDILKPENNISNMEFQTYITEILVLTQPYSDEDRAGILYPIQSKENKIIVHDINSAFIDLLKEESPKDWHESSVVFSRFSALAKEYEQQFDTDISFKSKDLKYREKYSSTIAAILSSIFFYYSDTGAENPTSHELYSSFLEILPYVLYITYFNWNIHLTEKSRRALHDYYYYYYFHSNSELPSIRSVHVALSKFFRIYIPVNSNSDVLAHLYLFRSSFWLCRYYYQMDKLPPSYPRIKDCDSIATFLNSFPNSIPQNEKSELENTWNLIDSIIKCSKPILEKSLLLKRPYLNQDDIENDKFFNSMYFFCLDILNQFEQTDKTVRKYFPIIEIAFKLRIFSLFKISRMLLENMERSMSEDNIYLYRTWALAGNSVFNLKNLDSKVRETKDFEIYLNPENLSTYEISKKIKQTLKVISTFSEETGSNFDISKSKLERFFKKKTSLSPNEQDLIFYAFIFNEWQDEQDTLFTI